MYIQYAGGNTILNGAGSGDVLVGTNSSIWGSANRGIIQVNGTSTSLIGLSINGSGKAYLYHDNSNLEIYNYTGRTNFANASGTILSISGSNVGIGTTAPNAKLDVNGTTYLASQVLINGTTNSNTSYMYDANGGSYYQAPPALIRLDSASSGSIEEAPVALFIHNENGSNNTWTKLSLGSRETAGSGNSVSVAGIAAQKTSGTSNSWASGDLYLWTKNGGSQVANMVLKPSGYVGIGTTNPGAKLHVSNGDSSLALFGPNTSWGAYLYVGASPSVIGTGYAQVISTDGNLHLDSATAKNTYINYYSQTDTFINVQSGKVGVGTSAPQGKLSVDGGNINFNYGNAAANYYVVLNHNNSNDGGIIWQRNNSNDWQMVNGTNGDFWMYSYGTSTVTFTLQKSTSNVGIGTTNPGYKLQVVGAGNAGGVVAGFAGTGPSGSITIAHSGNGGSIGYADVGATNNLFYVTTGAGTIGSGITMDNNGNVGIGITNPGFKLTVSGANGDWATKITSGTAAVYLAYNAGYGASIDAGTSASSATYILDLVSNGTSKVYVRGDGNVGIGTTNPGRKFVVTGAANDEWIATFTNTGTNPYGVFIDTSANSGAAYSFATYTNAGTGFFVLNNGNVGIGTTSPSATLDVRSKAANGATNAPTFRAFGYSANSYFQVNSNTNNSVNITLTRSDSATMFEIDGHSGVTYFAGNVGIGSTSPGTKLTVAGGDDVAAQGVIEIQTAGGTNLKLGGDTSYSWIQSHAAKPLYINQLGNNVIFNSGGGSVGIGTTSPSSILNTSGSNQGITHDDVAGKGYIRFRNSGTTLALFGIAGAWEGSTLQDTMIAAETGLNIRFYTNGSATPKMFISGSGNVGIGTTNPSEKLSIAGSIYAEGANGHLTIKATSGNNSYVELHDGTSYGYLIKNTSSSTANGALAGALYTYTDSSKAFQHIYAGTPLFTILSSGNVGINTTGPGYKLEVQGNSYFGDTIYNGGGYISWTSGYGDGTTQTYNGNSLVFLTNSSSYTARMFISSSGNIGIGTTTPTQGKLVVNGGVYATSFTGSLSGTATVATNLYGPGGSYIQSSDSGTSYTNHIQLREANGGGSNSNSIYAPALAFHWSGVVASNITIESSGRIAFRDNPGTSYENIIANTITAVGNVDVTGTLTAAVKSFVIDHPTKADKKLQYGVLEGPEHSVYVRGKLKNTNYIPLPDYWHALVHEDSITVNITAIGRNQEIWVNEVTDRGIYLGYEGNAIEYFYTVFAERKDIDKLITEFDKEV
jgi:hypothetical protein